MTNNIGKNLSSETQLKEQYRTYECLSLDNDDKGTADFVKNYNICPYPHRSLLIPYYPVPHIYGSNVSFIGYAFYFRLKGSGVVFFIILETRRHV